LSKTTSAGGFMPSFQSLMETILHSTIYLNILSIYDPSFLSVGSWMVSNYIQPSQVPPNTFYVYKLIAGLQSYAGNSLVLPPNGITLLEAK
jgi:hypothetical protein